MNQNNKSHIILLRFNQTKVLLAPALTYISIATTLTSTTSITHLRCHEPLSRQKTLASGIHISQPLLVCFYKTKKAQIVWNIICMSGPGGDSPPFQPDDKLQTITELRSNIHQRGQNCTQVKKMTRRIHKCRDIHKPLKCSQLIPEHCDLFKDRTMIETNIIKLEHNHHPTWVETYWRTGTAQSKVRKHHRGWVWLPGDLVMWSSTDMKHNRKKHAIVISVFF